MTPPGEMAEETGNAVTTGTRCDGWCYVAGSQVTCELEAGHSYEHEITELISVTDDDLETPFLVWWEDGGRAFVGSKDAVDTGNIA